MILTPASELAASGLLPSGWRVRDSIFHLLYRVNNINNISFPLDGGWETAFSWLFHVEAKVPVTYTSFRGIHGWILWINSSLWFCPCPCPCPLVCPCPCPGPLVCPCPCPHIEPCPLLCCVHSKSWTALGTMLHFPRANFIIQKIN